VLHAPPVNLANIDAKTIAARFNPEDFADYKFGDFDIRDGKLKALGEGSVEYRLQLPAGLRKKIASVDFICEAASDAGNAKVDWPKRTNPRRDHPQTDVRKWPSRLSVAVDGKDASVQVADDQGSHAGTLPDDPADARGVLSHYRHRDPGSYGYVVRATAKPDASAGDVLVLRLSVDKGLQLFDGKTGRFPLRPTLLLHLTEEERVAADAKTLAIDRWRDKHPAILPAGHVWQFTTNAPPAEWNQPGFTPAGWQTGPAGFGTTGTPSVEVRTEWNSADVWLRTEATVPEGVHRLRLRLFHDEDCRIYVNGKELLAKRGYITDYEDRTLDAKERALFQPGKNVIAVHCHQTGGGQGIDVQLYPAP
jgi:hypothetical protein